MNNKIFEKVLKEAVNGDKYAIEIIINEYLPLIDKYSSLEGQVDEDCKQYIKYQIIKNIKKFKLM